MYLLSLNFGASQNVLRNLILKITWRSPVTMCSWSLSTDFDPVQYHGKLSGLFKIGYKGVEIEYFITYRVYHVIGNSL